MNFDRPIVAVSSPSAIPQGSDLNDWYLLKETFSLHRVDEASARGRYTP